MDVINKIEFSARNLTSNAGLFLLLEHADRNGIFDLIENDLVFENESTNKIKMNHITMRGSHQGEFQGIPATGKPVTVTFSNIMRFEGGKIAELWGYLDAVGLMQQLGVIPAQN